MKLFIQTKNGQHQVETRGVNKRYRVMAKSTATEQDVVQFWTYLKYEFTNIDLNRNSQIFSASDYQMRKIKSKWGNKFTFETP